MKITIGPFGALGILFVLLKLTDVVSWSWWWVTSPFWFPWAIAGLAFVLAGIYFYIFKLVDNFKQRKNHE